MCALAAAPSAANPGLNLRGSAKHRHRCGATGAGVAVKRVETPPRQGAASASRSPFSSPPGAGGTRFGGFALILDDTAMPAQRNQSLRTTRRPTKIPFWATGPHAMPPFRLGCGLARHPVKSQSMTPFCCSGPFLLLFAKIGGCPVAPPTPSRRPCAEKMRPFKITLNLSASIVGVVGNAEGNRACKNRVDSTRRTRI